MEQYEQLDFAVFLQLCFVNFVANWHFCITSYYKCCSPIIILVAPTSCPEQDPYYTQNGLTWSPTPARLHSTSTQASHVSNRTLKTPILDQPSSHHWFTPNLQSWFLIKYFSHIFSVCPPFIAFVPNLWCIVNLSFAVAQLSCAV